MMRRLLKFISWLRYLLPHLFIGQKREKAEKVENPKIGLCITATGRYLDYAAKLIESVKEHFLKESEVTIFLFTDGFLEGVEIIPLKRLGWPYDSLYRFRYYLEQKEKLSEMDYLFALDADMLIIGPVGEEILSKRVATKHPGFIRQRGTYETRSSSLARVRFWEGKDYFAGGFWGGEKEDFFHLAKRCDSTIKKDLENEFIALWHDESHLNRYFIDFPPTKILSPSYCYPEGWSLKYPKKILALEKNAPKTSL